MPEPLSNCYSCAAQIVFPENQNIVRCPYCGNLNERPQSTGDALKAMVRANELRRQRFFEEAAQGYEYVLREHPHEHAALWGRLMCKYGVEAVEDRRHGRLISRRLVCHRARSTSIRNEGDFRSACEKADDSVRRQYEEDAEYIDRVQAEIRRKALEKEDYDVFICYKDTDPNDPEKKTEDRKLAFILCNRFLRDGFRVFFAPYTLKDKYGEDYEAEIYHAIDTARVMFVVGLKPEHFYATWPRSEWQRFLEIMAEKRSLLIPVYGGGMRAEDLPVEFRNLFLQSCNIEENFNYLEELTNTLYRVIPEKKPPVTAPPPVRPTAAKATLTESPEELLEQGMLYYQEGASQNLTKAFSCFERAAEALPEAQRMLGECHRHGKGTAQDAARAVAMYRRAAELGDAEAQNLLGLCYAGGEGIEKDLVQAAVWFKRAATQGHADAQNNLGNAYYNGEGMVQDYASAAEWYQKAAEQGHADAQYRLGSAYCSGTGTVQDYSKAAEWFLKAAEQGHADAQNNLGVCYAKGEGVAKDPAKAVEWYRKAADQGLAKAQFNLGVRYDHGEGVAKDPAKAVEWYRKAAEQGNAKAQCNLGVCYANGEGVAKDDSKAADWYRKAAEQGYAKAQFNLGNAYFFGNGVVQDYSKAVDWYRKAANQGLASAQFNLGLCYANGCGVAKDYSKAVEWYQKAAEQGDADAQCNLGTCYANGEGVAKDDSKAVEWYLKAAEQGNAQAQFNLGVRYENGVGVAKDLTKAAEWYQKAAEQGDSDAVEALEALRKSTGGWFRRLWKH